MHIDRSLLSKMVTRSPRERQEFTPDSSETLATKGDVSFIAGVEWSNKDGSPISISDVREKISLAAEDAIGFINYIPASNALVCVTNQDTYSALFQTTLEHLPETPGLKGYTTEGYREQSPAKIPGSLADLLYTVHLNTVNR